ncbi:tail fiber assembly protein [Salmonella enterica subsp. salamae]|nr:tail fiber assembly protein [Salmonella enterica subsp. salamae]
MFSCRCVQNRLRQAEESKNSLLQIASEKIAPLQDVVDLDIATNDEKAQLDEWKKYLLSA